MCWIFSRSRKSPGKISWAHGPSENEIIFLWLSAWLNCCGWTSIQKPLDLAKAKLLTENQIQLQSRVPLHLGTQLCNQTLVKLDFPSSSLWIFNWKERKGSLCSRWNFSKSGQNSKSSNSNSADCKLGKQKRGKGTLLKTRSHPFFQESPKMKPLLIN